MGWRKYKLKDLVDNFSIRARDYGGAEGLEFLGVSNEDGITKSKYAAEDKGEDYKIIEKGCFAYNPYRVNVGSIGYLDEDVRGLISPAYVVFKTKQNSICDALLFKFLKSAEGLRQIKFQGRGTVRQALRFEDLCKIEISLPSYEEQFLLLENIKLAEKESCLLNNELTNQLSLVKQLRQSFLSEAMQGKLICHSERSEESGETGQQLLARIKAEKAQLVKDKKLKKEKELPSITAEEIPFEIPKDWVWCRLGEFCYITSGSTPKSDAFVEEGIPFLKMFNLRNQKIDFFYKPQYIKHEIHNGQLKRCRAYPGDVIMNIVGPPLGKIAVIPDELTECNFNQAAVLIRPFITGLNWFVFWYLNEMSAINEIDTKGVAGQANISVTQAQNIKIPLPPVSIQNQIVAKLDELMKFCDDLENSIKASQLQNEQLLQQVLKEALEVREGKLSN